MDTTALHIVTTGSGVPKFTLEGGWGGVGEGQEEEKGGWGGVGEGQVAT